MSKNKTYEKDTTEEEVQFNAMMDATEMMTGLKYSRANLKEEIATLEELIQALTTQLNDPEFPQEYKPQLEQDIFINNLFLKSFNLL